MGILDGVVEWIAEQVMNILDMINTSVLGALGCDMETFLRYFPAAETFYSLIVALAVGLLLLNLIFQLFRNFGIMQSGEAENPIQLTGRTILFLFLALLLYHPHRQIPLLLADWILPFHNYLASTPPG